VRIAHISDCFVPRLGGIEMQVNDLTRRQAAAGHEPEVLTATPLPRRLRGSARAGSPVRVHRSGVPIPAEILNNPLPSRPIEKVLRAGDFDVVHVHAGVGSPFAAAGLRVALRLGLPIVVTVHCLPASFRLPSVLTPWLAPELAARVAMNAVSEAAAAPVRERTGVGVAIIPNGLDPGDWAVPRAPGDGDTVHAVSTMRLSVRKRPLPLLAMVLAAQRRLPDGARLRLTVFGDGKLLPRMRGFVARHGMSETVHLAGRVDRAQLTESYRAADVFVAPAYLESFGIAALEARCAGLPVLAMRGTGITEFVRDGVDGLLADGDPGMVDALVRMTQDDALRARITEHNRTTPPPTSWAEVLERMAAEYDRARSLHPLR
jgi:glycogen synthase